MNHNLITTLQIIPDIEIIEETKTKLEPLYRVIIHNDDMTPMDFVVKVLTSIFMLGTDTATEVMFKAHVFGLAYVQTLPKAEAEKRINKSHFAAGLEGYPLHFSIEPE
jgi:ATP-dependent Clp protease adaptor protein ClpS